MKTKEELKEQITKKLTDMGFDSFNCILTINAREHYVKIVYPELGLCFFKEYDMTYSPFSGPSAKDVVKKFWDEVDNIKKFNKTLKLKNLENCMVEECDKYYTE